MRPPRFLRRAAALAVLATSMLLAACSLPPAPDGPGDAGALSAAIAGLGPDVERTEAERAAELAFAETHRLAQAYEITDPPLVHNFKVNAGLRPRGLCWHWADDLEARLAREDFATLALHRAIANGDNPFRIDHSTVILGARGAPMDAGIVLDPWRKGGRLHWTPVRQDTDYGWVPRQSVWAERRARAGGG